MLTPLKLATYEGELAKWDNFSCVVPNIQSLLTQPLDIERIESRFEIKIQRIPIKKIINIETGIKFNTAQELADKMGCKRSSIYSRLCLGAAVGYVNVATKEFVTLGSKRTSIAEKIKLIERGFKPAHFTRGF